MRKTSKKIIIGLVIIILILLAVIFEITIRDRYSNSLNYDDTMQALEQKTYLYNDGNIEMISVVEEGNGAFMVYKDSETTRNFEIEFNRAYNNSKKICFEECSDVIENEKELLYDERDPVHDIPNRYEVLSGKLFATEDKLVIKIDDSSVIPISIKELVFYPISDVEAALILNNKWKCNYDENTLFDYSCTKNGDMIIEYRMGEKTGKWNVIYTHGNPNKTGSQQIVFQEKTTSDGYVNKKDVLIGDIYLIDDKNIKIEVQNNCTERSDIEELIFQKEDTNENNDI